MGSMEALRQALRCPSCRGTLYDKPGYVACVECAKCFPVLGTIPILINDENSVFRIADFVEQRPTTFKPTSRWAQLAKNALPSLGVGLRSHANFTHLTRLLKERPSPRVLVVGGSILGHGMGPLVTEPGLQLVDTDVSIGERTALVCDAHDLPFADETFDAVVAQAVLEHVVDPNRCVDEIHRVLRADGLVYAETPFMQQVHGGQYDFTRFTPLGHRRLFRHFEQIDAGSGAGPATVLAWSYWYFLRGFARTRKGAQAATVIARLTGFWLKYIDRLIVERDGAQDGSWGYFFLGRKAFTPLSDRDLLTLYRGLT